MKATIKVYNEAGTLLGECPQIAGASVQDSYNDVSAWSLQYPKSGLNVSYLTGSDDFRQVAFLMDGVEKFRGIIEDDTWDEVEVGGTATFAGREVVGLFSYARVYPDGGAGTLPAETTFTSKTPGFIMRVLLQAAQTRGCLPGWTFDFTDSLDSSGAAWSQTYSITYRMGVSLLEVLLGLGSSRLVDWKTTGLVLNMYNPNTTLAVDRSTVIFRRGKHLASSDRSRTKKNLMTTILVGGDTDVNVERVDSVAVSARGRKEGFSSQGGVTDTGTLNVIGDLLLTKYAAPRLEKAPKMTIPDSMRPWFEYEPGNLVYADFTGTLEQYKVVNYSVTLDKDGFRTVDVSLNDFLADRDVVVDQAIARLIGGSTITNASGSGTTPGSDVTPPKTPTALSLSSSGYINNYGGASAQVTATWTAPTQNADNTPLLDLDTYVFRYKETGATEWGMVTIPKDQTHVSVSPLRAFQSIDGQIAAKDTNGNVSTWSATQTVVSGGDAVAPNTPSTPVLTNKLGTLRAVWDGKDSGALAMPADFKWLEVHYSTTTGFTPSATTLWDSLTTAGVSIFTGLTYGTSYFVKFVAVDIWNNRSTPSAQQTGVVSTVTNGDIASLDVGKLTAGVLAADVTISARIKTANTGARVELNTLGIKQFDAAGTQTVYIPSDGTAAIFAGTINASLINGNLQISGTPNSISVEPNSSLDGTFSATLYWRTNSTAEVRPFRLYSTISGAGTSALPYFPVAWVKGPTFNDPNNSNIESNYSRLSFGLYPGSFAGDRYRPYIRQVAMDINFYTNKMRYLNWDFDSTAEGPNDAPLTMNYWSSGGTTMPLLYADSYYVPPVQSGIGAGILFWTDGIHIVRDTGGGTTQGNAYGDVWAHTLRWQVAPSVISSRMVKHEIRKPDFSALEAVRKASSYMWKFNPEEIQVNEDRQEMGPIREDLPKWTQETMKMANGKEVGAVNTGALFGILWAAVEELDKEVRQLKGEK